MTLAKNIKEIAAVIGEDRALFLIGKLPRALIRDKRWPAATREMVIMYVPKVLKPDHILVQIIGWNDALKLVGAFGGEILRPETSRNIYAGHRDAGILRMAGDGVPVAMLSEWFDIGERHIRNLIAENPQVGPVAANDNNASLSIKRPRKLNERPQ